MSINEKTSSTNIFISFVSNLLSIEDISKGHTSNLLSNYKPFSGWVYEAQVVAFKAGLWKSFLDDAIREETTLSMNKGTDEEVFDSKAKLPIRTTPRGKYTWEKDGTLVSSEKVGLTGVRGDRVMKKIKKEENTWGHFGTRRLSFRSQYQSWRCSQLKFMPEKDDFSGQTCLSVAS
ncbi:hypothetical protein IGI04_023749 [Brassica rapa subsp. trilocularis]|uniref:Uncharacterized protein n=1 Tax=Brassica rapa subsp. trilocularis TaxID=1813537 RepID=A0ABQ7M8X6_BRACM|nr:hypothetical protein IGI04_023749 [Brassica rapa subsp. trilocularis]